MNEKFKFSLIRTFNVYFTEIEEIVEDQTGPTSDHLKELATFASKIGRLDTKESGPLMDEKIFTE